MWRVALDSLPRGYSKQGIGLVDAGSNPAPVFMPIEITLLPLAAVLIIIAISGGKL